MALVDYEGFDTFTSNSTPGLFDQAGGDTSAIGDGVFGYGRSWRSNQATSGLNGRNFSNRAEVFCNFHMRIDAIGTGTQQTWFSLQDAGTVQMGLRMSAVGELVAVRGTTVVATSAYVYPTGAWVFVQVRALIDNAVGVFQVYVNGVQVINVAGNTRQTANNFVNQWRFNYNNGTLSQRTLIDNFVLYDPAAGSPNALTPETRVYFDLPNADGATIQWTPSAGANWQNVDENPPDGDTTYNLAASAPLTDLYAFPNTTVPGLATVYAVGQRMLCRKDDAGVNDVDFILRTGGSDFLPGAPFGLNSTFTTYRQTWTDNPDTTAAWTPTEANDAQAGIRRTT